MKENNHLSEALAEWQVAPPTNPQFRAQVWARLDTPVSDQWMHFLRVNLATCAIAASLVLGVGVWMGHLQAERQVRIDREALAAAYLASIDARYQIALQDKR
jgi:hypothetical protein